MHSLATMYKFASKHDIKYILTGGNYATECIRNPLEWMWYQSDSIQLRDIHKQFGTVPLKNFLVTNILWHKFICHIFRGIKLKRPLDFIDYDKEKATQELEKSMVIKGIHRNTLNRDLLVFMKVTGSPRDLDTIHARFNSVV